ncbi:MAG: DJ-1/PfpI family protein [Terriglobia bacterium]
MSDRLADELYTIRSKIEDPSRPSLALRLDARAKLTGKRVCFLVAHEFEDVELLYPVLCLSAEGAEVSIATLPKSRHVHTRPYLPEKPITGRFGSTVPFIVLKEGRRYAGKEIDSISPSDADAFVIPGGFSPDYLRVDHQTLALLAAAYRAGKLIAAICHGPQVLISVDRVFGTDMIRHRKVTGYEAVRDDLLNAGGDYADLPAVREGHVITGRIPDDLPEFCNSIIEFLAANTNQ